ncbi:hypothetical protein ACFQV4_30655 [Streptomyces thermocarboxydus]
MLGQLLAQGIVSNERTYKAAESIGIGIGFPYQAFGDDRVVRSVFAAHQDEIDSLREGRPLDADSPCGAGCVRPPRTIRKLHRFSCPSRPARNSSTCWLALPAGHGHRRARPPRGHPGLPAGPELLGNASLRSTRSVNERTITLLNETASRHGRTTDVLAAVLAVTAEPGHLLNADRLHRVLVRRPRPERDAWWGVETYAMLWDVTALHRLLRWAEQYPTPHALHPASRPARPRLGDRTRRLVTASGATDEEVVRLAATTLVWTLTSSNRFLRDRATKALVQLLLGHGDVLVSLLDRFLHEDGKKVDDPYLFERLVWVAYGVVARRGEGEEQRGLLGQVARRLVEYLYGDIASPAHASRNALLCDGATRIVTMAHGAGAITGEEAGAVRHPHACPEVGQAPAKEDLDALFPGGGRTSHCGDRFARPSHHWETSRTTRSARPSTTSACCRSHPTIPSAIVAAPR